MKKSSILATVALIITAAIWGLSYSAQAEAMKRLLPLLTEEEAGYFRRGRNIGHSSVPKNATVSDYRTATGMEALFGFLHLAGRQERIAELFRTNLAGEVTVG